MRLDLQQAKLEHLKQADRPGADDHGIGLYRSAVFMGIGGVDHFLVQLRFHGAIIGAVQRTSSFSLSVLSFHSSASAGGTLRLVMLFQVGSLASSALSLVMCC